MLSEYWLCDNREIAEKDTIYKLKGMLSARQKNADKVISIEEILKFVEESINEEETRLNSKFPEKAR